MKVLASTTAGTGHFEPMVPVLRACAQAGHDVLVACPDSFVEPVAAAGFACAPFDDVPVEQMGPVFGRLQGLSYDEGNRVVLSEVYGRLDTNAALPRLTETVAQWRPDVVVRDPAEFASWLLAERAGLPAARVAIGLLAMQPLFAELAAPALEPAAQAQGVAGGIDASRLNGGPVLAAAPERFDPADGGETHRFRTPAPRALDAPLELPSGDEPLVYVTFGTVAGGLGLWPGLYRTVVDALADLEVRVLVTTGRGADHAELGPLPDRVTIAHFVPQAHLLPHVAVMVTHGGYGTVLGGLRAGVPMVVTPMFADQADNAARVAAVGAGRRVQPSDLPMAQPPELGPQTAAAVRELLDDQAARETARELSRDMAAHEPVGSVVSVLEAAAGGQRASG